MAKSGGHWLLIYIIIRYTFYTNSQQDAQNCTSFNRNASTAWKSSTQFDIRSYIQQSMY